MSGYFSLIYPSSSSKATEPAGDAISSSTVAKPLDVAVSGLKCLRISPRSPQRTTLLQCFDAESASAIFEPARTYS